MTPVAEAAREEIVKILHQESVPLAMVLAIMSSFDRAVSASVCAGYAHATKMILAAACNGLVGGEG